MFNVTYDPDDNGHVYGATVSPFGATPVVYSDGRIVQPAATDAEWTWRATDSDGKNPPVSGGPYPPEPMTRAQAVQAAEEWMRARGASIS
jgi:hypothetical protein